MDVIVMAGTTKPSELTQSEGVQNKAFVQIHGQTMLSYVVAALRQVPEVKEIVIVGPAQEIKTLFTPSDTLYVADEGENIVENIQRGLAALSSPKKCLLVAADSAFLTAKAVENFMVSCQPYTAAVYYPIISRTTTEQRFPGVKRNYVKLVDGEFTGGNVIMIDSVRMKQVLPQIERIYAARKSPWRLVGILGVDLIMKFLRKRLTIAEIEQRFEALFSIPGQAVIVADAELGTDVDKPEDLELARDQLAPF
jgi:GTP:adenosylcobinamide-phosphate guanylyltransferase